MYSKIITVKTKDDEDVILSIDKNTIDISYHKQFYTLDESNVYEAFNAVSLGEKPMIKNGDIMLGRDDNTVDYNFYNCKNSSPIMIFTLDKMNLNILIATLEEHIRSKKPVGDTGMVKGTMHEMDRLTKKTFKFFFKAIFCIAMFIMILVIVLDFIGYFLY